VLRALGHPERRFAAAHVGGTNGKGSTSCYLERLFRAAGARTGLYTSPHLVDFRERIRVAGRAADREELAAAVERLGALPEAQGRTFFEAATAIAFERFAAARAQLVVAEVGLGGRLDCTNVLEPSVVALAPVALDHTEILGRRLEDVAAEKGGILKPGVPAVSASQATGVWRVLEALARERRVPLERASQHVRVRRARVTIEGTEVELWTRHFGRVRFRLAALGRHQAHNAALALAAFSLALRHGVRAPDGTPVPLADLPGGAVEEALAGASWPGRLARSRREPRLWWDGAHNPHGARALARTWQEAMGPAPTALVLGVSSDKPLAALLAALGGRWSAVYATQSASPRAVPAGELAAAAERAWGRAATPLPRVADAVRQALEALAPGGRVLVAGSLFVVGEAMAAVGEDPSEDLP
jgi:dihydrofolate synthase/folylpolyglutamate synthase